LRIRRMRGMGQLSSLSSLNARNENRCIRRRQAMKIREVGESVE
jgi:hypothetical protein